MKTSFAERDDNEVYAVIIALFGGEIKADFPAARFFSVSVNVKLTIFYN